MLSARPRGLSPFPPPPSNPLPPPPHAPLPPPPLVACDRRGLPTPAESVRWALADVALRPSASARDALAWAYYSSGKYASAAAQTRAVLATGSQEAHVLYHSGMILMSVGQIEEARKLLQKPAVAALIGSRTFHAHR